MRYLLDTDHCSYLQRRHPEVVRRFRSLPAGSEVLTSAITQGELLAGILQATGERRQRELRTLYQQFLLNIAEILPVTSEVAREYAAILTILVQKGKPIPANDIWIAAVARAYCLILVSGDVHFQYVDGLQIEDWTKPARTKSELR